MAAIKHYGSYIIVSALLFAGLAWKFDLPAALALIMALCVLSYLLIRPFAALGLLVLLLPLELVLSSGGEGGSITLLKLVSFVVFGGIVLRIITRKTEIRWTPVNVWIILYLLAWGLALVFGDPAAGTWSLIKDLAWFVSLFLIGLYGIENEEQAKRLVYLFLSEMTLIALFGYYQVFAGSSWISDFVLSPIGAVLNGPYVETLKEIEAQGRGNYWEIATGIPRVIGTFYSPDYYCAFLGYPISFALAIFLAKTGKERHLALIAWLLMFGNVLLTYSRGGWLALAASTTAMILATGTAFSAALIAALCVPVLIYFIEDLQAIPYLGERLFNIGLSMETDPRLDIWSAMLEKIKEYPILGHGEWGIVSTSRFPLGVHAHNLYLELLYAVGIVGLSIFLVIITITLLRAIRERNRSGFEGVFVVGFLGALTWFICHNVVDFQFHHAKNGSVFWLMLGMFYAVTGKRRVQQ